MSREMTTNNAEALRAALEEIEPVGAMALAAWGPKPDFYTAEQMIAFALASQPQAAGAGGDACLATYNAVLDLIRDAYRAGAAGTGYTEQVTALYDLMLAATPAPAVSVDGATCVAIYDAVSRANLTRDVKSPERKCAVVRAALNPETPDGRE